MVGNRWLRAAPIVLLWFFAAPLAKSQSPDTERNLPDAPRASAQQTASQNSSSGEPASQSLPAPNDRTEVDRKKAEEQLKQQERQRVLGVMAAFNTTNNKDAVPLSAGQKYQLFFKSATDPWPFLLAGVGAGIDQAENSFPQYGQGVEGYAKRFGANYTDYFTGNFFGNAVLTSLLHEDPRYFQMGTGSFGKRALWAAASTVWSKRDNGTWGPNYANVVGNLMGSAVSNLYYPAEDRTVKGTVERGLTVSAEGIVGAEVIEFWPDVVRHYRRKQQEKLERQTLQKDQKNAAQPAPETGSSATPAKPPANPED